MSSKYNFVPTLRFLGANNPEVAVYNWKSHNRLPKLFGIDISELNDIFREIEETYNSRKKALLDEHRLRKEAELGFLIVYIFSPHINSAAYRADHVEFERQMEDFVLGLDSAKNLGKRGLRLTPEWASLPAGHRGGKRRKMKLILEKID